MCFRVLSGVKASDHSVYSIFEIALKFGAS